MGWDIRLLVVVAAVWLSVAILYRAIDLIDMPEGERIWGLSAIIFLGLTAWIAWAQRRRATPTDGDPEGSTNRDP